MEDKISNLRKDVLVDMVKMAQKRGMEGAKGAWKEFLVCSDRRFGSNLSDPSKRSVDILDGFLKTFTKQEDLMFFDKILQWHSNRDVLEKLQKKSPDSETPEQKLVRLTLEHPIYPIDFSFPSHEEEWVVTKLPRKSKKMRSSNMVAVDCEMVLCEDSTEALVRVCVVDRDLKVKLNELVNPNKAVADYRTNITGITAKDLSEVTCSLADVQISMKRLLSRGTILIGHSVNNDMQALKLDHPRVIDTSLIFRYMNEPSHRRPSLNNLCKSVLGHEVRKAGAPHNCLDDARAAMKLVLSKIESGTTDTPIAMVHEDVPEIEMEKLLIHNIPIHVSTQELRNIFTGDCTIERQPTKKIGGKSYSAMAIFKSSEEADKAFENVIGEKDMDSSGRPQKSISFKLSTGETVGTSVRKMADSNYKNIVLSMKRPFEVEESLGEPNKKLKIDQVVQASEQVIDPSPSCDHLDEIGKLKELIGEREREIAECHNIISNLLKKH